MAKSVKHYEVRINYIESENVGYPSGMSIDSVNKPDYLALQEPLETADNFIFDTIDYERVIIMKSIVGLFRYKPIYGGVEE